MTQEVPLHIARAAALPDDFDKLVAEKVAAGNSITQSFYMAQDDIQEYIPEYQRYPDHMSYFMYRRRKVKKMKKQQRRQGDK